MLSPPTPTDPTASVDAGAFREGMSRVAGAVHLVATDGPAGRAGFTATAVTPVTDTPGTLLVCVNAAGRSARLLVENAVLSVNTLAMDDKALAEAFAGRGGPPGDRFALGRWDLGMTGSPLLRSALASFDCRLAEARLVSTHFVIIAEVVGVRLGADRPPLVYCARGYHSFDPLSSATSV